MDDPTVRLPVCLHCGTTGVSGENFCRNCGKQLRQPNSTLPPTTLGQGRESRSPLPSTTYRQPPSGPGPQTAGHQSPPPTYAQPGQRPITTMVAPAPPQPINPSASDYRPPMQAQRKRGRPFLTGCLIFIGIIGVLAAGGGIYVWRASTYSAPVRNAPDLPKVASGTMTEFPVDNDPTAPARPESVQTESLTDTSKKSSTSTAKLPPGVDRGKLSKGATTMTSSVYKPKPKNGGSSTATIKNEVYHQRARGNAESARLCRWPRHLGGTGEQRHAYGCESAKRDRRGLHRIED